MKRILLYLIAVITLPLITSCSENGTENSLSKDIVNADFILSTRAASTSSPTTSDPLSNEKIHSWWVAFVNSSNTIEAIVEGNPNGVEEDYGKAELPAGRYTVIAFANIVPQKEGDSYSFQAYGKTFNFAKGESVSIPELKGALYYPATLPDKWNHGETLIPMSGLQEVNVTGQWAQPFNIEVVRQVAKLELRFCNASPRPATIHALYLRYAGDSSVSLFPDYDALLGKQPTTITDTTKIAEIKRESLSINIPSGLTDESAAKKEIFYLLESIATDRPNENYTLLIDMTRGEGTDSRRDVVSALIMSDSKPWMTRNDHIIVPITFNDWVVKLSTLFYPPIGGYPAVLEEEKNEEYYVTFGTAGDFSMKPSITKYGEETFINLSRLESFDVEVDPSSDNIFTKEPRFNDTTKEILGSVGNSKGKAKVKITFKLKDEYNREIVTYSRYFYIIRN